MMLKAFLFAAAAVAMAVFAEEFLIEDKLVKSRELLQTQCQKNNAGDKVDQAQIIAKGFVDCIKEVINVDTVMREIEEAKHNGTLKEEAKKYCAKSPQLKTCIDTLLDGVSPCVDPNAREQIPLIKNGINQLIDQVCYKDGDRIVLFCEEMGPECVQSKVDDLEQCAAKPQQISEFQDTHYLLRGIFDTVLKKKCEKYCKLTSCVVRKLETCSTPTPAKLVEALTTTEVIKKWCNCTTTE